MKVFHFLCSGRTRRVGPCQQLDVRNVALYETTKIQVQLLTSQGTVSSHSTSSRNLRNKKVVCPPGSDGPSLSPQSEKPPPETPVDLRTCTAVTYESKDGLPGVRFLDNSKTKGWTTVWQKSRQRRPASESASNTDSETEIADIVIPPSAFCQKYVPAVKEVLDYIPTQTNLVSGFRLLLQLPLEPDRNLKLNISVSPSTAM